MKKGIAEYISKCMKCQQVKVEHQHPTILLHPFPILERKWELITMDFITGLTITSRKHDSILVVVDKFSKPSNFIPVKYTYKVDGIARILFKEIFKLHGLPKTIVSYCDSKFTSRKVF